MDSPIAQNAFWLAVYLWSFNAILHGWLFAQQHKRREKDRQAAKTLAKCRLKNDVEDLKARVKRLEARR